MALADKKPMWDELECHIFENKKDVKKEWKFYSKKAGWSLVFKAKGRTLLYFIPCKDYFKVYFVFGNKAVDAAKNADLPEHIIGNILSATAYVEGTSFDVDVKSEQDLQSVLVLLEIKGKVRKNLDAAGTYSEKII